uniref:DNA-directed RNA polymerase n=1 Tax=Chlorogonium capillatum TaxID=71743 RepID=A0A0S2ICH0_9CHLO|nr:beta subunit of RNA polymerase [Chlorogonium capillatum]
MPIHRYFLSDFVTIQRQSFFQLLEKGLIEEFQKRNPITNLKRDVEIFFYPEHYRLTRPEYSPQVAILKNKSYTSKLFVPVQVTDKKNNLILLKWVYIGNIPIMTKRGHFILNGAARVIVNQILRSPGIYYQQKIYENYEEKWSQKPDDTYRRYYADLICMRGTWLRIEMDKEKNIWAQTKKGPKIPIYWFLVAMGLSEKTIFKCIRDSHKLLGNLENKEAAFHTKDDISSGRIPSLSSQSEGIEGTLSKRGSRFLSKEKNVKPFTLPSAGLAKRGDKTKKAYSKKQHYFYLKNPPEAWREIYALISKKLPSYKYGKGEEKNRNISSVSSELGRKWLYNRFLNPRSYDLGKHGRQSFNRKLGLNISNSQTTLTGLDVLYATDYLIKVEKGLAKIDDIDHLKNRRVRTSGELIQIQIGVGLVRLEKSIRDTLNKTSRFQSNYLPQKSKINVLSPKSGLKEQKIGEAINKDPSLLKLTPNPPPYPPSNPSPNPNPAKGRVTNPPFNPNPAFGGVTEAGKGKGKETGKGKKGEAQKKDNRKGDPSGTRERIEKEILDFTQSQEGNKSLNENWSTPHVSELRFGTGIGVFTNNQEKVKGILPIRKETRSYPYPPKAGEEQTKNIPIRFLTAVARQHNMQQAGHLLNRIFYSLTNTKAFNSAIREFFGTSPLSQFMDQINPLAELTHKRRLSSMGPGGVTRDTATLEIRGIHPTHYGRICPIETPEGKNTGLVNSMTTYARINPNGIIESPFYKVYKGIVQKNTGMYYFSAEQEEKIKLAAADLSTSSIGFLPKSLIPVRIAEDFTKIPRSIVQYIGVSPLQMISIAASLIPFLEHDDANRALMGSNMQRQAVPLIRPERPIVGTGLEARTVSDSGHAIISKYSGLVTYVSAKKIVIHSFVFS